MKYQGSYCALITPFKNDKFDEESFIKRERIYRGWVFICAYCLEGIKKKYEKSYEYGGTWKSRKK